MTLDPTDSQSARESRIANTAQAIVHIYAVFSATSVLLLMLAGDLQDLLDDSNMGHAAYLACRFAIGGVLLVYTFFLFELIYRYTKSRLKELMESSSRDTSN